MTIVGLDDTDSSTLGMCTTYVGNVVADRLEDAGYTVERVLLIRLNPSVKHKTRGNAAVSIHTTAPEEVAFEIATEFVSEVAATDDEKTHPGVVVSAGETAPKQAKVFANRAIHEILTINEAESIIDDTGMRSFSLGKGRGRIGSIAAIGAWDAFEDWTFEHISYRQPSNWGEPREFDEDSMFEAAEAYYPEAWDTVDSVEGETVAAPHTPCPILYGVRGDKKEAVRQLSNEIESEPVFDSCTFLTNQGTDMHLNDSNIENLEEDLGVKTTGEVSCPPHTKEGGHVFFEISDGTGSADCVAFEPTKRFRDVVRNLRVGDTVTVCGEYQNESIKLEKLKVVSLNRIQLENPSCPDCGCNMSSAGAGQGYRCRDCGESADEKTEREIDRNVELGWYEVPPCARRHIAKPLVRGGFSGDTHPFR